MRRAALLAAVALLGGLAGAAAPGHEAAPAPAATTMVPHAKFLKAVMQRRAADDRGDRLARLLRHQERYDDTLTLAHLVYPAADQRLADAIMGCESGHDAAAQNPTSTAGGRAQYLDTTWASTPEGRAGLSRFDPVASVFAIMRHLQGSGNDPTPWTASRGCWGARR